MAMDYIEDIIRSGMAEEAVLVKKPYKNNEFGDPEFDESQQEEYTFYTVADNLNEAENEVQAGDYIEGDMRFYVSEGNEIDFNHGDFIRYKGKEYNITETRVRTIGQTASHKEVIVENV